MYEQTVYRELFMALSHKYTRKLYRFLKEGHRIKFDPNPYYAGRIHYPKDDNMAEVILNPKTEVVSTLIHEALHHFYPDWSETQVLRMERSIVHSLSERQIRNIIKRLAESL